MTGLRGARQCQSWLSQVVGPSASQQAASLAALLHGQLRGLARSGPRKRPRAGRRGITVRS